MAGVLILPRNAEGAAGWSNYTGRVTSGGVGISGIKFDGTGAGGYWASNYYNDASGNITFPMFSSGDAANPYYWQVYLSRSGVGIAPSRYNSWLAYGADNGNLNAAIWYGQYSAQINNAANAQGVGGVTVAVSGAPSVFREVYPALAIPDNNATGVTTPIVVAGSGTVSFMKVYIAIRHTFIGDLEVALIHPDGTTVILHNRVGGGADNLNTFYPDLTAPNQSLTAFNGRAVAGTWNLRVRDLAGTDTGLINYAALVIASATDVSTTQYTGTSAANGAVTLANWEPGATVTPSAPGYSFSPASTVAYPLVPVTFTATDLSPVVGPGAALSLNGSSQYITVANDAAFSGTNAITIEAWIKASNGTDRYIVAKEGSFWLGLGPNGTTANKLSFYVAGVSTSWLQGARDLNDNLWHHVAGTYDGSTLRVYVDGVLDGSRNATGLILTSANPMQIGARNGGSLFAGSLAEVRVWNIARSGNEIVGSRSAALPNNLPGLMAYYRLNEGSGIIAWDSASAADPNQGGAQNGTLVNGPVYQVPDPALGTNMVMIITEDTPRQVFLPAKDLISTVTYSGVSASVGMLTLVSGGTYLYTPPPDYSGPVTISYTASDAFTSLASAIALQVQGNNDPPVVGPGRSLAFNGNSQYGVATNGVIPTNGNFTVECWVLAPASAGGSYREILSQGDRSGSPQGTPFYLGFDPVGRIRVGDGWPNTGVSYPFGSWHHLALVKTSNNTYLYLDGVLAATAGYAIPNPTPVRFALATQWGGLFEFWNGSIADVRIWNVARDASQIAASLSAALPNNLPGLSAYYRLNEGSGTNAFNAASSNAAPNLTLINGPSYASQVGPFNSLTFNGSGSYIQVNDGPENSIIGPITLEAWVRPGIANQYAGVIEKFDCTTGGYVLRLANGVPYFYTVDSGCASSSVIGITALNANTWYHLAAVWNGSQLLIYVNGVLEGTTSSTRNPKDCAAPLLIGQYGNGGGGGYFNGQIGDVRLWKVARSAEEITAHRSDALLLANTPDLALYYRFDDGAGITVSNTMAASGLPNGTLFGFPAGVPWRTNDPLGSLMVLKYTEDVPTNIFLPAFDVNPTNLVWTIESVLSTNGTVSTLTSAGSPGLYTFRPYTNYNGPITINYTVRDGFSRVPGVVRLQGIPVEDPPTLQPIALQNVPEVLSGATTMSVNLFNVTGGDPEQTQVLSVTVTNDNPSLFRHQPAVQYLSPQNTATISYKQRPGVAGDALVTVTVSDNAGMSYTQIFTIHIALIDTPPLVGPATTLLFNGTNYASLPGFGSNTPVDEITIEFWQLSKATAVPFTLRTYPVNSANTIAAQVPAANGNVIWDFGNSGGEGRLYYTPPVPVTNTWQHFALVASKSGNFMKIYRNGIEEATKPNMTSFVAGTNDLRIGMFAGQLADFRVWSVARTAQEIQGAMNATLTNNAPNLVAYYRFLDGGGDQLKNFSTSTNVAHTADGVLVDDGSALETTPVWTATVTNLAPLQILRVVEGATNLLYLPAYDILTNGLYLAYTNATVSTGALSLATNGLLLYIAPLGYNGAAVLTYAALDSYVGTNAADQATHVVTNSVNLLVLAANNLPPVIGSVASIAAVQDSSLIEIPFSVSDDGPLPNSAITIVLLQNAGLIQSTFVTGTGNFRTLHVVPMPGEIGTVLIRILVTDAGGKQSSSDFNLRIEPSPAYGVIDLGMLPAKSASFGAAINDRGAIAGYQADTEQEANPIGFFYNGLQNGGLLSQIGVSGTPLRALAINNSYALAGMVGSGSQPNGFRKGIEDSGPINLQQFAHTTNSSPSSFARSINDPGNIAGYYFSDAFGGKKHAFYYPSNANQFTDLGTGPSPFDDASEAYALNGNNQVVGATYMSSGLRRAFLATNGLMLPLFSVANDTNSVAFSINNFGQVAGSSTAFGAGDSALLFDGINDSMLATNLLLNTNGTLLVSGNSDHSVEAWVKLNGTNAGTLLSVGDTTTNAHHWQVLAGGTQVQVGMIAGGSVTVPMMVGAWTHLAAVYTAGNSNLSVYVNGVLAASGIVTSCSLQGIPLKLGSGPAGFFNGALDEVRVWNGTRSAAQIGASYNQRLLVTGLEPNLVVYYAFDEATGTNSTSLAPGHLIGRYSNNPTWTVRAGLPSSRLTVAEGTLSLDGFSGYALVPGSNNLLSVTGAITVEALIRPAAIGTAMGIVEKFGNGADEGGYALRLEASGKVSFYTMDNASNAAQSSVTGGTPVVPGTWSHVAGVWDAGASQIRVYVNGVLDGSGDVARSPKAGTTPLIIGARGSDRAFPFMGTIDDVRIWNLARSQNDLTANIRTRLIGTENGLVSVFTFDEGGGTTVGNHVGGLPVATLMNSATWAARDSGQPRAFFYDSASGRLQSLGTLPAGGASEARAVNDFGEIAGTALNANGLPRAFFYSAGQMNDLNDLIPEVDAGVWRLESASGINASGAIVGTGTSNGLTRAYLALPGTVIGKPVIRPLGAVETYPQITILRSSLPDDSANNAFLWSAATKKLYAIRPVVAKIEWFTSTELFTTVTVTNNVNGTNQVSTVQMPNTNRIVTVTINVWPKDATRHIARAPVELLPAVTEASYAYQGLIFVTNNASVEPSSKVFTCTQPGYTVVYYLKTGAPGTPANPQTQPPYFEVVRTVSHDDQIHSGLTSADWTIGQEITHPIHTDYNGRNGYVLFEKAPYDGSVTDSDRAYDRATRQGPIIAVNKEHVGPHQEGNPDPLLVVWYHTNRIGVAWASYPVSYGLKWPADDVVDKIVIASATGSGRLDGAFYDDMRLYNQPLTNLPGFNPNEEHALVLDNTLFAVRDDLNAVNVYSPPYALLKYRNTNTTRWAMRVFKVVPEDPANGILFRYDSRVAVEVQAPAPLNKFWCKSTLVSGPGWYDFKGKLYAKSAGPEGGDTNLVVKWFYEMQPGFYHPDPTVKLGDCLAWLDQRTNHHLTFPNSNVGAGTRRIPIDITYHLQWDAVPTLQIGETLIHSKAGGLPEIYRQAQAQMIFDDLHPTTPAGLESLVRFYDPLTPRIITGVVLPAGLQHLALNGKWYFPGMPWMLKIRLAYDPVNQWLSFGGYLDENFGAGSNPLLLPNVLSERERDTIKNLAPSDTGWQALINQLYALTRNPNRVNLNNPGQQPPDAALRVGLMTVTNGNVAAVVPEPYSGGPKVLTAALGGVPPGQPTPGNAVVFNGGSSYVSVGLGTNGFSDLSLANGSFTIEFWAQVIDPTREQYLLAQPYGSVDTLGQLRIGFRGNGQFAFDLGTSSTENSLYNSGEVYTDTNWHHWACSFDASSFTRTIYRDGEAILNTAQTNVAIGGYTGSGAVELGRFLNTNYFNGRLDEVRIWKSARSGADIASNMRKRLIGFENGLEVYYRCDETSGAVVNLSRSSTGGYAGTFHNVARVSVVPTISPSVGQWGIAPRYITLAFNNDESSVSAGLPITLQVIRIDDGPYLGDVKVLPGDNVFDERVTLRHSSDFGGDPNPLTFEWYYQPIGDNFNPEALPEVDASGNILPGKEHGWIPYTKFVPLDGHGVNYVTTGEGSESGLVTISDNAFICRYKGYAVNVRDANTWSGWVGDPSGTPVAPRAVLAEGWVKRVIRGLNPFDARTRDFHSSPASTYASMLIQAGPRYVGPIAFNPSADAINSVGLIEAYQTVLDRARGLSIDGAPPVDDNPANNALLLAGTKISDLYMVLGNEAYADAQDPTIGFGSDSTEYGTLSSSIFAFENQLDSLLEEELVLLRGRDKSAAGIAAAPVYNRLFWNFTLGEGEIAYKQVYNITDVNGDGFIDDKDSRVLYPQGHGDAWGHYLTATKQHYTLLRHPYFTWVPRSEFVSVAGVAVKVDFLDERKFAKAASAKAKVGAETVDHTYRLAYVDNPAGQWQGYKDTVVDKTSVDPIGTPRAWGVTEWSRRASMGAYFDWVIANAILPSTDPNPAHTGIDKIDRHTVGELADIPPQSDEIQTRLDEADAGLNPLGLAKGVVPFDIDPVLVASGKTHFEQIQDRALTAMNNAQAVWDQVNKATQGLRRSQDSVAQFAANSDDQERDYKNRLIEVFGYPYAGDIGPGKAYANGYDGPDLLHYNYVAVKELNGQTAPPSDTMVGYFKRANASAAGVMVNSNLASSDLFTLSFPITKGDWSFVPPASWGARRAPGEIQMALSDFLQAQARLKQAMLNYDNLVQSISDKLGDLASSKKLKADTLKLMNAHKKTIVDMNVALGVFHGVQVALNRGAETVARVADVAKDAVPTSAIFGLAGGGDLLSAIRGVIKSAAVAAEIGLNIGADVADVAGNSVELAKEGVDLQSDIDIETLNQDDTISGTLGELTQLLRTEAPARVEAFALREALQQTYGRYLGALARGERLVEERVAFRKRVAASTTESRYADMTYRIFRNDALQKYRATFDLAARYVFLAATAYDYETSLLGTDNRSGSTFLTDIIRQRSLGQVVNGTPVAGTPGLADPLARLSQNFTVLKSQLGFNNPGTEQGRFSLRNQLFRLRNSSDDEWRSALRMHRVANLWDVPEFRRYARSFAPESAGPQPGLVIRFPTTVTFGLNFFTWPLGGGDSAYDSSRFATKISGASVAFADYPGASLSQTPRVYLVPVGEDILRSPAVNDFQTRYWRVVDQVLPVPFAIGATAIKNPDWIPVNDSLGGSFADIRHFASFRAFPYTDGFDPFDSSHTATDNRLIGRSVWNTDWMLIIPGGTFLSDSSAGLETFIQNVTDIKLFLQTYSYPGN